MNEKIFEDLGEMKKKLCIYVDMGRITRVSEAKCAHPIKVLHYPEYLKEKEKVDYKLEPSKTLSEMDEKIRQIQQVGESLLKEQ
jgi:hypothetical protein